jgi:Zn-dependent M32 family carboxypeptidase
MKESPIQALGTYFHELGHAYQDLQNPAQEIVDRDDELLHTTLRGLHEAQAAGIRGRGDANDRVVLRYQPDEI